MTSYNIQDIIEKVESIDTPVPPSIHRFTGMHAYFDDMRAALAIIRRYQEKEKTWNAAEMETDMLVLSAIHAKMAEMVGYLQGTSSRAESTSKIVSAQYSLDIKRERDLMRDAGDTVKMNDEDVKAASRYLAKDAIDAARDSETISRIITNAWYAISSHVEVLRSALRRAEKEYLNS